MSDFYKIKASRLNQMMRGVGDSLSVQSQMTHDQVCGQAVLRLVSCGCSSAWPKEYPFCFDAKKSNHPFPPPLLTLLLLFKSKFLLGIADASSPPDKNSIKVNVHSSRGRLTVINTRKMSQDI